MNDDATVHEPDWKRKSFSLPTSLAEWVDLRASRGSASAYIAGLIAADRDRELARQELRDFGYTGDLEITDEGRRAARAALHRQAASRASRRERTAA